MKSGVIIFFFFFLSWWWWFRISNKSSTDLDCFELKSFFYFLFFVLRNINGLSDVRVSLKIRLNQDLKPISKTWNLLLFFFFLKLFGLNLWSLNHFLNCLPSHQTSSQVDDQDHTVGKSNLSSRFLSFSLFPKHILQFLDPAEELESIYPWLSVFFLITISWFTAEAWTPFLSLRHPFLTPPSTHLFFFFWFQTNSHLTLSGIGDHLIHRFSIVMTTHPDSHLSSSWTWTLSVKPPLSDSFFFRSWVSCLGLKEIPRTEILVFLFFKTLQLILFKLPHSFNTRSSPILKWMKSNSRSTLMDDLSWLRSYISTISLQSHQNPHPPTSPPLPTQRRSSRLQTWHSIQFPPLLTHQFNQVCFLHQLQILNYVRWYRKVKSQKLKKI